MNKEFSFRKKCLLGDLLWEIQLVYGKEHNDEMKERIRTWFSSNFEEFHIKHSVTMDLLENLKNDKSYLEYQDKSACYKLIDGLKKQAFVETKLDHPKDENDKITNHYIKEKTFSVLAMRNK